MNEYRKWMRTVDRVRLTPQGEAVLNEMAVLDYESTTRGVESFYRQVRKQRLMVALVERAARRSRRG